MSCRTAAKSRFDLPRERWRRPKSSASPPITIWRYYGSGAPDSCRRRWRSAVRPNSRSGRSAFAIGNPFGLDQSLTSGIISALKRRLPTSSGREISNVIQTDAAINPGNSGGPLLDSAGRLIGVNTAIISPSGSNAGIGFAIPVDIVNRVVPELIKNGRVPTPGIGIVAASEAVATRLGVEGVIVVRTAPGSPAERAGMRGVDLSSGALGDVIVEADGKPVHRLSDLTDQIEQIGAGKSIRISLKRGSQTRDINIDIVDIGRS